MNDSMFSVANLITGLLSGSVVVSVAGFFIKRWMSGIERSLEKLSARLDSFEKETRAGSVNFLTAFLTKEESKQSWDEHKQQDDRQWDRLDDHERRLTALETTCKMNHE